MPSPYGSASPARRCCCCGAKLAVPVLLVSLIAVVVQFSGLFLVPQLRQTVPDTALAGPIAILVGCYLIFHLARLAGRRGWLR